MKIAIMGILGTLAAINASAAILPIDAIVNLSNDSITVSEESAVKLYAELLSAGGVEKEYPELPGPSDVRYLPVKEVLYKNISCRMNRYNHSYDGVKFGFPKETYTQCKIQIKD
jgi:hypothetical protein